MKQLLVGGQKSGKSAYAERLAQQWLHSKGNNSGTTTLVATATACDVEMQARIKRHQQDRERTLPGCITIEEPLFLAKALEETANNSDEVNTNFIIVDCLTLWLTNWLMPAPSLHTSSLSLQERVAAFHAEKEKLLNTLAQCSGSVVIVSNEVGFGISPLGTEVRTFVDELGMLNQAIGAVCNQVKLCVAGQVISCK